jgi:hypothetical protein
LHKIFPYFNDNKNESHIALMIYNVACEHFVAHLVLFNGRENVLRYFQIGTRNQEGSMADDASLQKSTAISTNAQILVGLGYRHWTKGISSRGWQPTNGVLHAPDVRNYATHVMRIGVVFVTDDTGEHWSRKGDPNDLPNEIDVKQI